MSTETSLIGCSPKGKELASDQAGNVNIVEKFYGKDFTVIARVMKT